MQLKGALPAGLLKDDAVPAFVKAYFEFVHLKQLFRQGWLRRGVPPERCESVAEHTFGVAVLAMLLADAHFPSLDRERVLRMALLHDFGEIHTGDLIPADAVAAEAKHALEEASVTQVLGQLPNGPEYLALWHEFESGASPEAQFVRQIDRLEMALQASVYQHQGLVDPAEFFASAGLSITTPELQTILHDLATLHG